MSGGIVKYPPPYQTFIHEHVALGSQLHMSDVEKCSQMCLYLAIVGLFNDFLTIVLYIMA